MGIAPGVPMAKPRHCIFRGELGDCAAGGRATQLYGVSTNSCSTYERPTSISAPPAPARPWRPACARPSAVAAASAMTPRPAPVSPCPGPTPATHPKDLRFPSARCCDQRTLQPVQNRTSASPPPLMDALNYRIRRRHFHLRQAGSRRQIQAQHPLRRVEVVAEIVDGRHLSEDGADLCNAAECRLCLGFAVLDEAVDHAGECLDELRPGHLRGSR